MSEPVTLQVQGFCEAMMVKGEWTEFHINVGRQYPVKLATKKDEVKTQAMAAGQQQAVWTYNETEGNPNPHRPGENFKNRYLNAVEVGGTLDPNLAQPQQGGGGTAARSGGGGESGDERGRSIERQVIVKSASRVWAAGKIDTADEFFALLTRMDEWMISDDAPAATPAATPAEAASPPAAETPPDDDIPF